MKSTLFDTFNAKYLTNEQIGETFIANQEFYSLTRNISTLVLGPRGSGKTTMLKMLTIDALNSWKPQGEEERAIKDGIGFYSIYIPADSVFSQQLESSLNSVKEDELRRLIIWAIYNSNIFYSFVDTVEKLWHFASVKKTKQEEYAFCDQLATILELDDAAEPTFRGIKIALSNRGRVTDKYLSKTRSGSIVKQPEFFHLNYLSTLDNCCELFDQKYGSPEKSRWALCFDELELVPSEITKELLSKLRAVPSRFLFKLCISPLIETDQEMSQPPKKGDDFETIRLWPYNSDDQRKHQEFCSKLALSRINRFLEKTGKKTIKDLEDVLGKFSFYNVVEDLKLKCANGKRFKDLDYCQPDSKEAALEYNRNSLEWWAFKELAFQDSEFANFLEAKPHSSNAENPSPKSTKEKNEFFRKLKQLVFNRLAFTEIVSKNESGKIRIYRKSNFNSKMYHGADMIVRIVDGNPRYLIGIVDDVIRNLTFKNDEVQMISTSNQNSLLKDVSKRFYYRFTSIPAVDGFRNKNLKNSLHLSELIDVIGRAFASRINFAPLTVDPANCFVMDKRSVADPQLKKLVTVGVENGAFILIEDNKELIDFKLEDKRFRINYLLCPNYNLPLRYYKAINLSSIISAKDQSDPSGNPQYSINFHYENKGGDPG